MNSEIKMWKMYDEFTALLTNASLDEELNPTDKMFLFVVIERITRTYVTPNEEMSEEERQRLRKMEQLFELHEASAGKAN